MDAHLSDAEVHARQIASRRVTRQSSWPVVTRYARHDLPERFQLPEIVKGHLPWYRQLNPAKLSDEA